VTTIRHSLRIRLLAALHPVPLARQLIQQLGINFRFIRNVFTWFLSWSEKLLAKPKILHFLRKVCGFSVDKTIKKFNFNKNCRRLGVGYAGVRPIRQASNLNSCGP